MSLFKRVKARIGAGMGRGVADADGLTDAVWQNRAYGKAGPRRPTADNAERRPNPWFSPVWYRSRYPDVATSGIDPLDHWARFGWHKGLDPSGLFSTQWYLDQNPDVAGSGLNPLHHYLAHGQAEGRRPHPLLAPRDHRRPRVAVIVLSFNAPEALAVTLDSLAKAPVLTPFTVFLIENGSRSDCKAEVAAMAARAVESGLDLRYTDHPDNAGFSGGNNIGINQALAEPDFTHVCLLNSDVVVTPYWLDRLLDTGEPVVGPVANAVGNEQTVAVDYEVGVDLKAYATVAAFSERWRRVYRPQIDQTRFLGFFCVLIERTAIERVGLLDERFFPGSYEDDDYCRRLLDSGYELAVARHVYMHHFGSSSFSKLELSARIQIGDENRARFEEKWQKPWEDRTHLPILGAARDAARLRRPDETSALLAATLTRQAADYSDLTHRLTEAVAHFRREIAWRDDQIASLSAISSGTPAAAVEAPVRVTLASAPLAIHAGLPLAMRKSYGVMLLSAWSALEARETLSLAVLSRLQPLIGGLAALFELRKPVVVLAQSDPVAGDEKDGYVQRVKAIDAALAGAHRVYLRLDSHRRGDPWLVSLGADLWRLELADDCPLAEALLAALFQAGAPIYAHSLFGVQARTVRRLLPRRTGPFMLDLHGSVPEEFTMHDDPFSAQIFNGYEREVAGQIDHLVCVSQEMARHFERKHGLPHSRAILCPIFVEAEAPPMRDYNLRPRAIYAGGLQKWQQIPKLVDLAADARSRVDFILLTPSPEVMAHELARRELGPHSGGVQSRSASHAEVLEVYSRGDYGLLLRKDCTVNRVACPTKLIEYLTFGLVPVLDTPHVGDFVAMGMAYIPLEAFRAGDLPTVQGRKRMAHANRAVMAQLKAQSLAGRARITEIMTPAPATQKPPSSGHALTVASSGGVEPPQEAAEGPMKRSRQVIGLVVPAFDRGGLEQVVLNLYRGYKARGHACVVLVENNVAGYMAERLDDPDDIIIFNRDELMFLKACLSRGVTTLHFHYSVFGLSVARTLGIYTTYTLHNVYTWLDAAAFAERAAQIRLAHRVVAVSTFVRDYFCRRAGAGFETVDVIANGTDVEALRRQSPLSRVDLKLPEKVTLFANIASTHRNKHQAVLIAAAERVLERRDDFYVVMVGNVGDPAYHAEIEARLKASEARAHVGFRPFVPADRLGSFYRDVVDCVLLPSLQEGCSNVVLEALATDRPMVLSDVGNAREAAALSGRVRVVPTAFTDILALTPADIDTFSRTGETPNVDAVAEAMLQVMDDPCAPASATALKQRQADLSVDHMVNAYIRFIETEAALSAER